MVRFVGFVIFGLIRLSTDKVKLVKSTMAIIVTVDLHFKNYYNQRKQVL